MQEKIIKRLVVKQLKKEFPNWRRLPKNKKKQLAKQALKEAMATYDSEQESNASSLSELTGTPVPLPGIIGLSDMEGFIEKTTRCLLMFPVKRWQRHFDDPELREIDCLLDDRVLNELLAPEGFTPCMRDIYPCHYVRAELLKALRHAGMS